MVLNKLYAQYHTKKKQQKNSFTSVRHTPSSAAERIQDLKCFILAGIAFFNNYTRARCHLTCFMA